MPMAQPRPFGMIFGLSVDGREIVPPHEEIRASDALIPINSCPRRPGGRA